MCTSEACDVPYKDILEDISKWSTLPILMMRWQKMGRLWASIVEKLKKVNCSFYLATPSKDQTCDSMWPRDSVLLKWRHLHKRQIWYVMETWLLLTRKWQQGRDLGFMLKGPTRLRCSLGQCWHFHLTQRARSLTRGFSWPKLDGAGWGIEEVQITYNNISSHSILCTYLRLSFCSCHRRKLPSCWSFI